MKLHHLFSAVPRPFKMPVAALGSRCGEQALMIAMWRRRWERALASSGGDGHVGTRAGCRHLDSAGRARALQWSSCRQLENPCAAARSRAIAAVPVGAKPGGTR